MNLFSCLLILFSINFSTPGQAAEPVREWTVMLFANAKNNLEPFMFKDTNEAEIIGSTAQMNMLIQFGSLSQKNVYRFKAEQDNDIKKWSSKATIQQLGNVDMGNYRSVVEFVRWSAANYPARRYLLIISNHGAGWRGGAQGQAISFDDISGNAITVKQLGSMTADIAKVIGKPLDILGTDACLMSMVEIMTEIAPNVEHFIGSQELEPGDGWGYDRFLATLAAEPTVETTIVARDIVRHYGRLYGERDNPTLAAVRLGFIPYINAYIKNFGTFLTQQPQGIKDEIRGQLDRVPRYFFSDYADLLSLVTTVGNSPSMVPHSKFFRNFRQMIGRAIIANTTSESKRGSFGISIWLPKLSASDLIKQYNTLYKTFIFNQQTGWASALWSIIANKPEPLRRQGNLLFGNTLNQIEGIDLSNLPVEPLSEIKVPQL